jgi:hypothetical protein
VTGIASARRCPSSVPRVRLHAVEAHKSQLNEQKAFPKERGGYSLSSGWLLTRIQNFSERRVDQPVHSPRPTGRFGLAIGSQLGTVKPRSRWTTDRGEVTVGSVPGGTRQC